MTRIAMRGLSKHYGLGRSGHKVALGGITLEIGCGERVGIIGANGAGKSTLLQLIAGIATPSGGELQVEGHVTAVLTLGVGIKDEATGRENIYVDAELQGKSRAQTEAVLPAIVEFADLGAFIDRPVRTYSTGMKARLAFAMATHIDPEILLIDEALSVGDAAFAAKASRRIRDLCARGNIVVVVSHSLVAITEICNRCIWLEGGRVAMDGAPEEVTRAYAATVRRRDDLDVMQGFGRLTGALRLVAGFDVTRVEVQGSLRAGEPFAIHVDVAVPQEGAARLRIAIERLDGLLLIEETVAAPRGGGLSFECPGALAAGCYKLSAELLAAQAGLAAVRTHVFEIVADRTPSGGRPALSYPYSLTVEPLDA
jgi:lipopolysaccharide transport system ATP-binding protein